jgi:glycosyltransferase involved in cell wall biosynthesis
MDPSVVFKVAAIAKRHRSRVIHASGIKATLVGRIVARMVGAKAIVHVHDLTLPGGVVGALHGMFARSTDIGLCVSAAVRETAIKGYHVEATRTRVLYNGTKLDPIKNVARDARATRRHELAIPAEADVITLVGRIYPVKGHAAMLQMLPDILRRRPNTILLFVGDGPQRGACEALAARLGVQSSVRFAGHRADVPELLAASDVVVVPSSTEGLSYAAIEALAAGRPVVANRVGGLPEVVTDGVDGRCVALGDERAFVDAVVQLLEDRCSLEAFGRAAAANAERFSLARHVEQLLQIYGELAG